MTMVRATTRTGTLMDIYEYALKYDLQGPLDDDFIADTNEVLKNATEYIDRMGYYDIIAEANYTAVKRFFPELIEVSQTDLSLSLKPGIPRGEVLELANVLIELSDYPLIDDEIYWEIEEREKLNAIIQVVRNFLEEELSEDRIIEALYSAGEKRECPLFETSLWDHDAFFIPDDETTQESLESILNIISGK